MGDCCRLAAAGHIGVDTEDARMRDGMLARAHDFAPDEPLAA